MRSLPLLESRMAVHEALPPVPEGFARSGLPKLTDAKGRAYDYLRLSVTDRCDLACVYCMPPGGEEEHAVRAMMLSFEEAARLVRVFASMGIERVRFTGGEPLVRRDLVRLIDLVRRTTDITKIALTTNAMRLAELARPLHDAGLRSVNVSLDSLDADRFREITRGGDLGRVQAGIHAAIDLGMNVKLNTVLLRGQTDVEAERIVDYAFSIGATPRFIELMPLGEGAKLDTALRVPASEVIARLGARLEQTPSARAAAHGPATYLPASDGSGRKVGFITPLSDEFCGTCNRVRITAQGDVRACLASRRAVSLRDIMRAGGDDRAVAHAIHWSLSGKADGHAFLDAAAHEHDNVGMSLIGG